jgi:hypothetical protein
MAKVLNVAGLSGAAKQYDPILRTLPFIALEATAAKLRLNLQRVENEHVIVNMRRKAGGTIPYAIGTAFNAQTEIAKFYESSLKPELVAYEVNENITNYRENDVLVKAGTTLDLKSKVHPQEKIILMSMVKSHAEDVTFAMFHAERDNAVLTPMTSMTGFYPALDLLVTAGHIAAGEGNLVATGAFAAPLDVDDTIAYDKMVTFIGEAHPLLKSTINGIPQLLISLSALKNVRDAYRNKVKAFQMPTLVQVIESLREDAFCPSLVVDTDESLGSGSKVILQKVGNMDLGFNTSKSEQFVQVRNIDRDPNVVQYWLEAAYGVRIRDVHKKVFRTNEQINTRIDLSGDY